MDFKLNSEQNLWYTEKDNINVAYAELEKQIDNSFVVTRVFVDSSLRGQGVANKVMTSLANFAKDNNIKISATCSYAVAWIEKHREYTEIYK